MEGNEMGRGEEKGWRMRDSTGEERRIKKKERKKERKKESKKREERRGVNDKKATGGLC
jgi:hypothetical protein